MFGRKTKRLPEQGRARQRASDSGINRPAFSYYASSRSPADSRRSSERQAEPSQATKQGRRWPRFQFAQLPFWLLVIVALLCTGKLLALNTNPKVIVVNNDSVAGSYVQPTKVYAQAAQQLLRGSLANRTKLTANIAGTTKTLQNRFPELQTASLTLPLIGNRPLLYLAVAPPSVILQTNTGNYALNPTGIVLAKVHTLPANVPTLSDQTASIPRLSQQYLPSSTISFLTIIAYQFKAAKLPIATFVLPADSPFELDARLEGKSFTARFNLQETALEQSGAAIATLKQLGATAPGAYLDVRTPERVYYK